ncbi:MAG: LacI family DNA-binding transcriptional regulator [Planctomycetota bacterium]|nr:LacI family DNA-binding transcriptional regulator [Planctomycetota bacterium]
MATLTEVAKLAGVSISTASKVLGGGVEADRISPQRADLVRHAAERLKYRPNYHARSLLRGKAQALGFVLHASESDVIGGFWARTIGGVADQARAHGYDFLVIGPTGEMNELERGLQYLKEGRIDALVAPGFIYSVRASEALHELQAPIVLAEYYKPTHLPVVGLDPAPGIAEAVKHLVDLGHREILWLGFVEKNGQEVAPERREAFERCAQASGIRGKVEHFRWTSAESSGSTPAFIRRSKEMFAEKIRAGLNATAVIAYNELMGLGIYAALHEAGLRVPRDLSVIGFDDIHADLAVPPMTTVSLMLGQIGRRAADLAVELAAGRRTTLDLRRHREQVAAQLIVKESTAAPRERRAL